MKTKIMMFALFVVFFGGALSVFAQPYRGYLIDKLNLSDKQISEIEKLRDEHLKKCLISEMSLINSLSI